VAPEGADAVRRRLGGDRLPNELISTKENRFMRDMTEQESRRFTLGAALVVTIIGIAAVVYLLFIHHPSS
jgi:hypothetical protein